MYCVTDSIMKNLWYTINLMTQLNIEIKSLGASS